MPQRVLWYERLSGNVRSVCGVLMLHFFVLAQARTAAFAICSLKMAWGWWTISLSWLMTLLHLLFMPLACKPRHPP